MINAYDEARKHLDELEAFDVPNPIVAKAISMQRLMKSGFSEYEARKVVESAFRQ